MDTSTPHSYRFTAAWMTFHVVMLIAGRFLILPFLPCPADKPMSSLVMAIAFCSGLLWLGVSWLTFRWAVHELVIKPPFIRNNKKAPIMGKLPYSEAWAVYMALFAALMMVTAVELALFPLMIAPRTVSLNALGSFLITLVVVVPSSLFAFRWSVRHRVEPRLSQGSEPESDF